MAKASSAPAAQDLSVALSHVSSQPPQKGKACIVSEERRFARITGERKLYLAIVTGRHSVQKLALLYYSPSGTVLARSHHKSCDLDDLFSVRHILTYSWDEIKKFLINCRDNWFQRGSTRSMGKKPKKNDVSKHYKTFEQWLRGLRKVLEALSAPQSVLKTVASLLRN